MTLEMRSPERASTLCGVNPGRDRSDACRSRARARGSINWSR